MSVLMALKLPKSIAIGIASLFRFIPALRETFSAMGRASLFRGSGFRLRSILCHPVRTLEYYLLPFLSRLSHVSDDLAAALATRGVGIEGPVTFIRDLSLKSPGLFSTCYGVMFLWYLDYLEAYMKLKDVSFSYQGQEKMTLQNINLYIQKGEFILLCGTSGCGKTTLTRVLNGLCPEFYPGKLEGYYSLDRKEMTGLTIKEKSFFCWQCISRSRYPVFYN